MPIVPSANELLVRLRATEAAFARDARRQRIQWRYRIERRHVLFDRETRAAHRRFRQSIAAFLRESTLANALTAPLTYSLVVPLVLADAWITLYQWTCFPLYGIARVPRRDYFVVDRHKLAYLNAIEKVNCTFCSYANGMIAYIREIAARTEQYWCPSSTVAGYEPRTRTTRCSLNTATLRVIGPRPRRCAPLWGGHERSAASTDGAPGPPSGARAES